jgi:gliding motility-associated-like protein
LNIYKITMIKLRKKSARIVTILSIFLFGVLPAKATIYPITQINDGNLPAGLPGSLREAINSANVFSAGLDTIDMSAVSSVTTISELPFLASDVLIIGPNGSLCTINGTLVNSVLTIANTGSGTPNVEIRNISFQNGFGDGGGLNIQNSNVILNNCLITNNFGSQNIGGGIRITNSTVQISNSTVSNNLNFGGIGGGIATSGECSLTVRNSTIFGNRSAVGGGFDIINPSEINIINCTVTNNISTGLGGGFYINAGAIQINNSIIVNNSAQSSLNLGNDIKINPDTAQDRILSTFGHNIIGDLTGFAFASSANLTGNIVPISNNSVLDFPAVLASNGGSTPTVSLNACSQAIDAGNDLGASSTDQRGTPRVNASDIGAYEYPALIPIIGSSCGPLSVQLSVSGGTSGVNSYNWFDAQVGGNIVQANSAVFNTPILSTTTTFYVAEAAACANPKRYPVVATIFPIPPTPTINVNGQPTTICDNASITLNAEVSQSGLQFLWNPGGQTTPSITVSTQASYTVTVISADNCTSVSVPLQINVVSPPPIPTIFSSSGSTSACQGSIVTLTSSSTFPNVWSTGETTQQITVSAPTTYIVTTSSAANCSSSNSFTLINFPSPPTPVISLNNGVTPFCFGPGNDVELISDIAPNSDFSLLWSNGQTTQTATFDTTGDYTVILTDQNNCTVSSQPFSVLANIPVVPTISASGDTTFCDGLNVVLTSTPANSYNWSVGGNTNTVTVSTTQTVTVTTIDANGCEATSSPRVITNVPNAIPIISPAGPITICDGQSVTLTSNIAVGNLWSNNETSSSIIVTTPGVFTTLLDGCSLPSASVEVFVNTSPIAPVVTADGPLVFCEGGVVNLTAVVGTGDLLWSNNTANTNTISVTESGSYSVIETNSSNCSTTSNVIVVTVNPLPVEPVISAQGPIVFCEGESVSLLSNINDVVWSNGISAAGITVSNSGSFSAVVTDGNNCSSTSNIINVTENVPVTPLIVADGPLNFCQGASVNLTAVPSAVSYSWTNGGNQETINVTQSAQNLSVITTDVNGCSALSLPIEVIVNPVQTPTISPSANVAFCDGGSVVLTSNSATGNLWSTGETTQSITVNSSQTITVEIQGCSTPSAPVVVTVNPIPSAPVISSPTNFINCSNLPVVLTSTAATGYSWSNGLGNNQTAQTNQPGDYTVTIFDINSCSATSSPVTVSFNPIPAPPQITSNLGSNTICTGGTLTLTSNYASGNNWSTGQTTQSITVSAGGVYSVTHTDINGCTSFEAIINVVEIPAVVPVIAANGPLTFCEGGSVILTSSIPFGNVWSTGSNAPSIEVNQTTSNITVANEACNISSLPVSVVVNENPATPTITPAGPIEICQGSAATLISSSLTGNTWSNGQTENQINVTESGNYSLVVTNAQGCSASSNTVNAQVFTFPNLVLNDINQCANSIVISAGNNGSTYLWSNGATTQDITLTSSVQNLTVEITNVCGTFVSQPIDVTLSPVPVVNIGGPFSSCINPVTLDAGNAGSTYLWNGGQTTQTISATSSGQYSVIVTNTQNCSAIGFADVLINTTPPEVSLNNVTQCGGSVTLDATNVGATYLWSPNGETTSSISVSQTTNSITVAVTNACGTTTSTPISVTINSASIVNLGNDITQCGGTVLLDAGISGVAYEWSGPSGPISQTTQTITVSQTGLYTVTITDGNSCNGSDQIFVNLDTSLPVVNLGNAITQCGGVVLLDAQNPGATYLWNNGETTQTININQTSSSFVEVTNGCGTTISAPIIVTINTSPVVDLGQDITQCGGTVELNAGISGATSYSWSGPSPITQTTQTINVSQTGTYSVLVTDVNGCTGSDNIFVNLENSVPVVDLGNDVSQCGGSVQLDAGNIGSTYVWSNAATTQIISVSESGSYFVTVSGACGTTVSEPINISINPSPVVTIINNSPVCNTTITLDAGNPGSTFLWTPGNITTQEFVASTSGLYSVIVTNAFNCSTTQSTQVIIDNNIPVVNLGNDIAQCGGEATLDAGNAGATYLWNFNNAQTQTIQVNQSGTYTVDVTNACGTGTGSIDVEIGTAPIASISQNISGCNSAILSVGTQPAGTTFNWNNGAGTNPTFDVTVSGTYSVVVTNSATCSVSLSTTVTIFNQNPIIDLGVDIVSCGSVTLDALNPGASYLWSTGATTQTINVTQSTLSPISVTVTNACGTTTSNAISVTISPNPPVNLGNDVTVCNSATLDAGNQPSNSTFVWSDANGVIPGTNQTITVTTSGTYSVLVTAPDGCTGTDNIVVSIENNLPIVDLGAANQTNCGTLNLNAGNAGATYLWSTGATTQTIDITSTTSNITVAVTNACGTTTSSAVNVTITPTPVVNLGNDITQCAGVVTLNAGTGANSYSWTGPDGPITGGSTITVNQSGTYSVLANFGNSCTSTDTIVINYAGQVPSLNLGGPYDVCSGTITLNAQNPGSTYVWSNSSTSQTIDVTSSGTYSVTVTNACGSSSSSAIVNIINATAATIVASGPTTFCQGGSVVLTATPGATYLWLPNGETTQSITVTTTGVYTCTVTYTNGCASTTPLTQVNVEQPASAPVITANGPTTFCQGGSVVLTSSNALNNVWSNGSFSQSIVVFNSGTYTVSTVVGSCSVASASIIVTSNPRPSAIINTANPTTFCQGDTATLFVSSPTGVNFQWFKVGLGGNPDILLGSGVSQAVFASGDYYALVTDINGCTRASFPPTNIVVKDSVTTPTITQVGTISPCNNKGTITLTSSSSTNNQWSTGATSQSITVESSGTFTVTVSNDFCSKISKPLVIEVTPGAALELKLAPKIYTPGDNNISVNGGSDGEIDLTVSGGVNPLNFQWLDSSNTNLVTTEDITGLKKGWYKVIVTDANECSAKDSIYLKEPLPFKLPEGFTPNGDGKNDFFVIGAIENYPDNKFTVYNRWGNIVYDKVGYKNEWDGNANNGESMAEGTYFITLDIPGRDLIKGFVDLRR